MQIPKTLLLILLIFLPIITWSQSYNFTHLDLNQGLSHNRVNCILKDSKGFLWVGTGLGLNRYDGKNFKIFYHNQKDTNSLKNNDIERIFEDPKGRIWVNTIVGLNIYNPETESFIRNPLATVKEYSISKPEIRKIYKDKQDNYFFITTDEGIIKYSVKRNKNILISHSFNDAQSISSNKVSDIKQDKKGDYWLVHLNGTLEKIDSKTNKVIFRTKELSLKYSSIPMDYNLLIDSGGDLWISVRSNNKGIFYFNNSSKSIKHIHENSEGPRLNTNVIRGVVEDDKGQIWIGTDHGGINILDKNDFSMRYLKHNSENARSLADNSISFLYKDDTGIIWIANFKKGLDYYHPNLLNFNLIKRQVSGNEDVIDDTNCFEEDINGNLWIGSNEGGLSYFDRRTNQFKYFKRNESERNNYPTNVIVDLLTDRKKDLWIGTYFGGLFHYNGKKFTRFFHNPNNHESIASDNVWRIFEDSGGKLWIGTLGEGLDLLDRSRNTFQHFRSEDPNSIHNNFISSISEDKEGNLWIGTSYGLDVLDKRSNRFIHYLNDIKDSKTISNNSISDIIRDSRNMIWVGTKDGLNLMDHNRKVIKAFYMKDGLPNNSIVSMVEDDNNNLWISTPNGLSNLIIKKNPNGRSYIFNFRNYTERDGLQGKMFNDNSAFKTSKGELLFGGPNGFNLFKPEDIKINKSNPSVVFSELQVFNKEVKPGDKVNGRVILDKSILQTPRLILKNIENVFSISFAPLNYFHPEKIKYSYKLEGFDKDWISADDKLNKVSYTNLNPGEYLLKIRGSDNYGYGNKSEATLKIIILPPFWKTKLAMAVYVCVIILTLFIGRQVILKRARIKFVMEQERKEVMRIHEVDMMKIKFFTNISHEFRTPLSLIITPIEKILNQIQNEDQRRHLLMMQRNAKRLLNLVNQLLDFRKIEVQEIKLMANNGEIVSFLKDVCYSFSDVSEKKNIKLAFMSSISELKTSFDKDKLERILFNLLSNAFKFTPEGGEISVEIDLIDQNNQIGRQNSFIEIKVKDTGIGIPEDKKEQIFERFFQNETSGNFINQGSGIGLSITKEFVQLHGGRIYVESNGRGSTFIVLIPLALKDSVIERTEIVEEFRVLSGGSHSVFDTVEIDLKKQTLLLVEDNEDFRFYLKDNLKEHFNILEAANGRLGWEIAVSKQPDLIVTDIMMPEIDGLALSRKVRKDLRTSHIPLILLTARSKEEQKIEGYNSGASEYITKPFNYEILLSRIKNLIGERELVKKSFQKNIEITPSEITITSLDQKLVAKAIKLVEVNISNSNFSVEEMGRELGMSRAHLYKKLLALTGKTPIEFIRLIRIKRAAQLLEKSQLTVSEVAYEVGINNLKYFAKYFKAEFNVLPSQYAKSFKEQ